MISSVFHNTETLEIIFHSFSFISCPPLHVCFCWKEVELWQSLCLPLRVSLLHFKRIQFTEICSFRISYVNHRICLTSSFPLSSPFPWSLGEICAFNIHGLEAPFKAVVLNGTSGEGQLRAHGLVDCELQKEYTFIIQAHDCGSGPTGTEGKKSHKWVRCTPGFEHRSLIEYATTCKICIHAYFTWPFVDSQS